MIIQWLTFAIMILIQAVAAGVIISAMRTTLTTYGEEIKSLRDWRHEFGPKSMIIDDHGETLKDHEARIREVEHRRVMLAEGCPVEDCPALKQWQEKAQSKEH